MRTPVFQKKDNTFSIDLSIMEPLSLLVMFVDLYAIFICVIGIYIQHVKSLKTILNVYYHEIKLSFIFLVLMNFN